MKHIVILGAGWAGLPLAHKLLKYTTPKDPDNLKVILVSPNSHFFWNVAATRGIIPGEIPDQDLFLPIEPAFARYPTGNFEFVLGSAEAIDPETNTVQVRLVDHDQKQQQTSIPYHQLVIATGSRLANNLPLKPLGGTHKATLSAWTSLQQSVATSHSIAISGAGPTGVEVAGELAARYGRTKEITLILSGDKPLSSSGKGEDGSDKILPSVRDTIDHDLQALGVKLIRNTKAVSASSNSSPSSANSSGRREAGEEEEEKKEQQQQQQQQVLTLSNGTSLQVDLHLPVHGIHLNTDFVPDRFLSSSSSSSVKGIKLDSHLRVQGTRNIWAIGDVGNIAGDPKQLTVTDGQIIYLSGALDWAIFKGEGKEEEEGGLLDPYQPVGGKKTMIFLSLGKKYATGQIGGWRLWRWLVAYVKGRKLFVDTAGGYVGGKHLRHASM